MRKSSNRMIGCFLNNLHEVIYLFLNPPSGGFFIERNL